MSDIVRRTHTVGMSGVLSGSKKEPVPGELSSVWSSMLKVTAETVKGIRAGKTDKITDVMTEAIKAEIPDLAADVIPYGHAIKTALKLSKAFADGIGKGIEEASAKLKKEYDKPINLENMTQEDIDTIQFMRQYQANSVANLNEILFDGVEALLEEAFDELKDFLVDKVTDMFKDAVKDYAKDLIKENDIVAMIANAAKDKVPESHAKALKLAFQLSAAGCVAQWGDDAMAKKLSPLIKPSGDVDVYIVSGLIRMTSAAAWDGYKRLVPVDYAVDDLKSAINTQVAKVIERLKPKYEIKRGSGEEVAVETHLIGQTSLAIPPGAYDEIIGGDGSMFSEEYWRANAMLEAYASAQAARLKLLQRTYQWRIDKSSKARASDLYDKLANKLLAEQKQANDQGHEMLRQLQSTGMFSSVQMTGLQGSMGKIPAWSDSGLSALTRLDLHTKVD